MLNSPFFSVTFIQQGESKLERPDQSRWPVRQSRCLSPRQSSVTLKPVWAELLHGLTTPTEQITMTPSLESPLIELFKNGEQPGAIWLFLLFLCAIIYIHWNMKDLLLRCNVERTLACLSEWPPRVKALHSWAAFVVGKKNSKSPLAELNFTG